MAACHHAIIAHLSYYLRPWQGRALRPGLLPAWCLGQLLVVYIAFEMYIKTLDTCPYFNLGFIACCESTILIFASRLRFQTIYVPHVPTIYVSATPRRNSRFRICTLAASSRTSSTTPHFVVSTKFDLLLGISAIQQEMNISFARRAVAGLVGRLEEKCIYATLTLG